MVYIEIIYLVLYSIVCFLVVRNIYKSRIDEIYKELSEEYSELHSEYWDLRNKIEYNFSETKKDIVDQNSQYLLEMNKDISKKIKDLSDTVKNKRIV
jgi:hypothetical protein